MFFDVLFCFLFQSNLSGLYDPCPDEEKMPRIRYLFREAVNEVIVGDNEPVYGIPKHVRYPALSSYSPLSH